MQLPILNTIDQTQSVIKKFYGYNHNTEIGEGELYDMVGLTSDHYPMLASRAPYTYLESDNGAAGSIHYADIADRNGLTYLCYTYGNDGNTRQWKLYYNGAFVQDADGDVWTWDSTSENRMVSFGAYILIFPDKKYYNTADGTCGDITTTNSITLDYDTTADTGTQLNLSRRYSDGTKITATRYGSTEPTDAVLDMLWVNDDVYKRCFYVDTDGGAEWEVTEVYSSFEGTGIGKGISAGDAVQVSGTAFTITEKSYDGEYTVLAAGDDYIVVDKIITWVLVAQNTGTVTFKTVIPDMDFVIECQNRLWGCKYGEVDGELVNEIYASKLGSFTAWRTYAGISTDAWAASIGTDGEWTGAVNYNGYPIFFKDDHLHKVYISSVGAHQIKDLACDGVAKGAAKSLAIVDNILYYFSPRGVMAYDGTTPESVFANFGTLRDWGADVGTSPIAAGHNSKYYICFTPGNLCVLDTQRGMWHKECSYNIKGMASAGRSLYAFAGDSLLLDLCGMDITNLTSTEEAVPWSWTSGVMGYSTVPQKYIARITIRMKLPKGSTANVYIEYDSSGKWEQKAHIKGKNTNSFYIPIIPRRCDHFRLKMDGENEIKIFSIARIEETGSEIPCHTIHTRLT